MLNLFGLPRVDSFEDSSTTLASPEKQLLKGADFLSPRLWKESEGKNYQDLLETSKKFSISERGELVNIFYLDEQDIWRLEIDSLITQNGKSITKKVTVDTKLKYVERTKFDKWGVQIDEIIETY